MKTLTCYIQEKLVIKKSKYNYFPQTKEELKNIIKQRIEQEGNEVNLNDIDVSKITDMSSLFKDTNFNGDIFSWDVSNVKDMSVMFFNCEAFNQDISNWDVSNVKNMSNMFYGCTKFNQDISSWNVSKVTTMYSMFYNCEAFNQDISNWDVSNVKNDISVFNRCNIEEKYKPKFK